MTTVQIPEVISPPTTDPRQTRRDVFSAISSTKIYSGNIPPEDGPESLMTYNWLSPDGHCGLR